MRNNELVDLLREAKELEELRGTLASLVPAYTSSGPVHEELAAVRERIIEVVDIGPKAAEIPKKEKVELVVGFFAALLAVSAIVYLLG